MIAALLGTAILGAGMEYRDGDGSTLAAQHFVYPNTGFSYQSEKVYLEANSPLPALTWNKESPATPPGRITRTPSCMSQIPRCPVWVFCP